MLLPTKPPIASPNPSWNPPAWNFGMGALELPYGLFAAGTNYAAWTWKEWAVIGLAVWLLMGRRR